MAPISNSRPTWKDGCSSLQLPAALLGLCWLRHTKDAIWRQKKNLAAHTAPIRTLTIKHWLSTICFSAEVTEFWSGFLLDVSISKLAWHIGRDCSDATYSSIMPVPNDLTTCWVSLLSFFPLPYTELNKITVPVSMSCRAAMDPLDFML